MKKIKKIQIACKFCGENHIDWEKECKYWGLPPLKIIGDLSSIPTKL